jgi:hypothetical protein
MQNNITFKTVLSIFFLVVLVTTMLIVQSKVKLMPTIIIATYTAATILVFVLKNGKLSTIFLIPIVLMCSFCSWLLVNYKIKDEFFPWHPDSGLIVHVEDPREIYCIGAAIILSLLTTFLYFKLTNRKNKAEIYILSIYLIATIAIASFKHI